MPKRSAMPEDAQQPFFELRIGVLHLTVQRVPGWLIGLVTTLLGAVVALWSQQ
ncbi:hypothetical protein [Streptomyces roseolus]|uniref:hypothetical protein n=1 Tax=Streptomyces roseolus TaxID=67358 RepID=UPI00167BAEE7|nr:hypothetical protein [Streptomyces roseolus]GGR51642.1 hypothetical protein GCM10010282_50710 [Streptomyces roseolus]